MNEVNTLEIGEKTRSFSSSNSLITLPTQTYRILGHWLIYALTIVFLVIGFTFLGIGIYELITKHETSIHNFLIFIALVIISCIITYFFPFYSSITVDMSNHIVTVKKYKLFFIIKKVTNIDTTEIKKAYTEINYSTDEKKGSNNADGFNLIFELKNGDKIMALEGEEDRNFEMVKIGLFMIKYFPGNDGNKNENNSLGLDTGDNTIFH
jgi:hypothetical protein